MCQCSDVCRSVHSHWAIRAAVYMPMAIHVVHDTSAQSGSSEMVHCFADMQGDWGTQFGMLIQFMSESRSGGLADPTIAELAISDLQVSQLTNSMHRQPAAV